MRYQATGSRTRLLRPWLFLKRSNAQFPTQGASWLRGVGASRPRPPCSRGRVAVAMKRNRAFEGRHEGFSIGQKADD